MKRVLFAVICLSMILFVGSSFAGTKDGVWQVYKAAYPPTIDGEMDDIYYAASKELVVKPDIVDSVAPDSYLDCFAEARLLWDETSLYVFIKVVDDEVSSTSANSYENDSAEIYFDGDNSKGEAYDGVDDVQTRVEYQDGSDATMYDLASGTVTIGCTGATADWEAISGDAFGYTIELAYTLTDIGVDMEAGSIFGFDIQINDRDAEARQTMLRWWGTSNMAWQQPVLFGEAELVSYIADDIMQIMQAPALTVDGILDAAWQDIPTIGMGTYVYTNADVVDASFTEIEAWEDAQMQFKAGWDADNFYLWVEVIDDEISTSGANSYENDSIELCFDGDNAKTVGSYDANDEQMRWVYGLGNDANAPLSVSAWGELDGDLEGYTFEVAIPAADLLFPLEADQEIGFEIQINERDNEVRENMMRWWGSDNMSWNDASRLGTAVLVVGDGTAVDNVQPAEYGLAQNFPNPFNPSTTINFNLDRRSAVRLTVFDVLGNTVAELVNDVRSSGLHTVSFDGSNLSSGVYFYKLETASNVTTKKMMLMK